MSNPEHNLIVGELDNEVGWKLLHHKMWPKMAFNMEVHSEM